jgi:lipopolysaccharide export system protein LptC
MTHETDAPDLPDQPTAPVAPAASELPQLRRLSTPRGRPLRRRRAPLAMVKIALPTVAVITIGYLVYWWWVHAEDQVITVTKMENVVDGPQIKAEVTVNDVKYDGKDDQGRPYSITAKTASHADGDERHIALTSPLADIVMASGAYVALTAQKGMLDRDTDIIVLNGDVTLFHDNGLSFQTDSATINMKDKTAEGSAPVEGQNGDGELISEGFRVQDDGDTIVFTGKAYMKIYPKQKDPDQPVQQGQVQEGQGG